MAIVRSFDHIPDPKKDLLDRMEESNYEFYPTGSRFFYPHTVKDPTTDHDFFVQDSEELRVFLEELGFHQSGEPYIFDAYDDLNTSLVMRAKYRKTHIDVQLQKDVVLKQKVQELLKKLNVLAYIPKNYHHKIWNNAFRMMRGK